MLRLGGGELVAAGYIPQTAIAESLDATTADLSHTEDTTMPGLLRGIAGTAAIVGTATAVSNRVSRRQANRWSQQEQQQYGSCRSSSSTAREQGPENSGTRDPGSAACCPEIRPVRLDELGVPLPVLG